MRNGEACTSVSAAVFSEPKAVLLHGLEEGLPVALQPDFRINRAANAQLRVRDRVLLQRTRAPLDFERAIWASDARRIGILGAKTVMGGDVGGKVGLSHVAVAPHGVAARLTSVQ